MGALQEGAHNPVEVAPVLDGTDGVGVGEVDRVVVGVVIRTLIAIQIRVGIGGQETSKGRVVVAEEGRVGAGARIQFVLPLRAPIVPVAVSQAGSGGVDRY